MEKIRNSLIPKIHCTHPTSLPLCNLGRVNISGGDGGRGYILEAAINGYSMCVLRINSLQSGIVAR